MCPPNGDFGCLSAALEGMMMQRFSNNTTMNGPVEVYYTVQPLASVKGRESDGNDAATEV